MWVVYVLITDDCTYNCKIVYGFARTEIGVIELEDMAKKEFPDCEVSVDTIKFMEDR